MFETMEALNKLLAEKDEEIAGLKKAHKKLERELAEIKSDCKQFSQLMQR